MVCKDVFGRDYPFYDAIACVGEGWHALVLELYKLCEQHDVTITQIKEKYGSLRFYVAGAPDIVLDAIEAAEKKSETTCELCGNEGKIIKRNHWLMCRCPKCEEKTT